MKNQTIFTVTVSDGQKIPFREYAKQYLGVHDSTFYDWVNCRRSPSRFRLQKIQMIVSHKMNKRHGASQH